MQQNTNQQVPAQQIPAPVNGPVELDFSLLKQIGGGGDSAPKNTW